MMSDNTNIPDDGVPLDDQGIRNDEIIEILDSIIQSTWKDVCQDKKELSISDRKEIALTLHTVWDLARDIMNIDEQLSMFGQDFDDAFEDFGEDPNDEESHPDEDGKFDDLDDLDDNDLPPNETGR